MHFMIDALIIFITWKWADWRRWKDYHATILFLPLMSLVYNFICFSADYFLWKPKPDFFFNHAEVELAYIIILLPCTVLLFLTNYPRDSRKIIIHFLKYIFIYSSFEAFLYFTGRFEYLHGWSIWHSTFFYFLMFPSIIIHHKKPILAYIIFILIIVFGVWYFKIPLWYSPK